MSSGRQSSIVSEFLRLRGRDLQAPAPVLLPGQMQVQAQGGEVLEPQWSGGEEGDHYSGGAPEHAAGDDRGSSSSPTR